MKETASAEGTPMETKQKNWHDGTNLDERLQQALIKGISDYLEDDLVEARKVYAKAVDIIEGPLMAGMNRVGKMFGEGKMFLPQVVKTARTMKRAVAILQPFIEKIYKTNNSKTIIGQSAGGLLATEILIKKPKLFNKYIIISPSLWWDNGSLLNGKSEIYQENFQENTDIYIGVGKEGLAPTEIPHVMEVDANLLAEKLKSTKSKHVKVHFDYLPEEDHATITHQAIFNALRILYPKIKQE